MIEELYKLKGAMVQEGSKGVLNSFDFVLRNKNETSITDRSSPGILGEDSQDTREPLDGDSDKES